MTSRFPLTLNTSSSTIEELPAGVDLDLASSNISTVGNIAAGNSVSANYFIGNLYGTANLAIYATTANSVAGANVSGQVSYAAVANSVAGANVTGTVSSATTAGTVTTAAQPNITSTGTLTGLTVNGVTNLGAIGNVKITGGSSGQVISTDGLGNLSYVTVSGSGISNGTSNVNIATADGNVTISVGGTANTAVFASTTTTFNTPIRTANSVYIGNAAGNTSIASTTGIVSIGYQAGGATQGGDPTTAVGFQAGNVSQSQGAVAIGFKSGRSQADAAVAIGYQSGETQSPYTVAVGLFAGQSSQGASSIAIGNQAGKSTQGPSSIAIGQNAGQTTQLGDSVAIGTNAGTSNQGTNSVAIGNGAGRTNQANNTIILNASGANLNMTTANTFTVKPVRNASAANVLYYDSSTGEITYSTPTIGTSIVNGTSNVSVASSGNVTVGVAGTANVLSVTSSDVLVNGYSVGTKIIIQNSQSADYTMVASDSGKQIFHPSADTTARTFTIPANSSVPYDIGTTLTIINQASAGNVSIAITTDTMRLAGNGATGTRTLTANGVATAIKVTSTEWIISGVNLT